MESKIIYKNNTCELTEDFIDVGYMAENIEVDTFDKNIKELKRSHSDGAMTLFVSFPNIEEFHIEILKLDQFMKNIVVPIHCYIIFAKDQEIDKKINEQLEKFEIVYDTQEEFGSMYGTKIVDGVLKDELTKSLFLISKDGAIFFLDIPDDLEKEFDLQRVQVELNKAYVTYTGVGCHG